MQLLLIYKFDRVSCGLGCGLGDQLRGLITLLQVRQRLSLDFPNVSFVLKVDISDSILNDFINSNNDDIFENNCKHIHQHPFLYGDEEPHHQEIMSFIYNQKEINVICLTTNAYPKINEIDGSMVEFVKNMFHFNDEFHSYMNNKLTTLPETFMLYHYRIGDEVLYSQRNLDDINKYIENFRNSLNDNDNPIVLISDSLFLKNEIKKQFPDRVFILNNTPHHISDSNVNIDTIVDFCLIQHSTEVRTYSNYRWISNFVFWTSNIFGIPLTRI